MTDSTSDLLLFFNRPTEPCFMQKGDEQAVFELPDNYYPDKYKYAQESITNRFGNNAGRSIPIRNIALPNLSETMELPYNSQFSLWIPKHRQLAGKLIDVFMGMRDVEDLKSVCSYCQLRVNPYMFNYCLSVALLHRPDTKRVPIPTFAQTFPDKFVDPKVFRQAREATSVVPTGSRMPVLLNPNYTASDLEPEQRVAYFREDIGVNLHHWHWHLVYPYEAADIAIVNKDRRGELFYYMHQQIIARYNTERYCNRLARVRRYDNFRAPIEEGYFPKLDSQVASRAWPPRFANTTVRDLDRPVDLIRIDVSTLETWRQRFIQAIETMTIMLPNNRRVPLDPATGIDTLGNMMEASLLSPNGNYYGNLHNLGHVFISYSHDPDHRHLEQAGVMGDSATAMRDPVFYRWHSHIDDLFVMFKTKLGPYGNNELDFAGVRVASVSVEGTGGNNTFSTRWEQSTIELGRGLDFTPRGSILARFTHLQHEDFNYVIEVNNTSGRGQMGTVRIFIAPTQNEQGQPLPFNEQRRTMIELDKFTTSLNAGNNVIRRRSIDSSVTIPYDRTFQDQTLRPGDSGSVEAAQFDFCGCGWPHHMLLPKGTQSGFPMVLFVMVSNWNEDRIEQDLVGTCNDAASYCGIRDRLYPDRRAMGFPFDRPINGNSLRDFLRPNMNIRQCTIRYNNVTLPRQRPGMMNDTINDLLLFFHRPSEPCFMPKGEQKAVFDVPYDYYPEKYKHAQDMIASRFAKDAGRIIPVRKIALPNLSLPKELPFNGQFSLWIPKHRIMSTKLIEIFMETPDLEDLKSVCTYCQLNINPYMFNYCLSVALLHRRDTTGLNIPTFAQTFPDKFMDPKVFRKAREVANVVPIGSRKPIVFNVNYTASDDEPEQKLAYFREDIGLSLHHWHWHLVYPYDNEIAIVNKDRRGELFYYMHQQVMARYNTERYCNGLARTKHYNDFNEPIEEAYFPKLDSRVAGRVWPPRFAWSKVKDVNRPVDLIQLDISTLETWRTRFIQAIETLSIYLPNGTRVPLEEENGMDLLGNMMESSIISPNRDYYGNFHNMGHLFISVIHDPDNRHLEPYGVMVDSATAMRDPSFYRWHAYIDELFQLYKYNLSPYGDDKLGLAGIQVTGISVESPAGTNTFGTRWEQSMVELGSGLDFTPRGSVLVKFTHLQHDDFNYIINVNNTSGRGVMGTVRIFIGAVHDDKGEPLPFDEQRKSMIELDKFTTTINSGVSAITRSSVDSSVTIPYERTFTDQASRPGFPGTFESAEFDFCRCGWPHHMLLPKGTKEGFPMVLFVMISDWTEDRIEQDEIGTCNDASSYCGIRDRRYPDRRAMGFPFDRPIPGASLTDFLRPNMSITQCKIRFNDVTHPRQL